MSRLTNVSLIIESTESNDYDNVSVSDQYEDIVDIDLFNSKTYKYVTLEKNFFALDGEATDGNYWTGWNFYDGLTFSYLSNVKSDSDGNFSINPYALIELASTTSAFGFLISGQDCRVLQYQITFYDIAMSQIKQETVWQGERTTRCDNFKYVKIEAIKAIPFSYAKNLLFEVGGNITIDNSLITSAGTISGTDISLETLPISTMKIKAIQNGSTFDFGSDDSILKYITKGDAVSVTYNVNDTYQTTFTRSVKNISTKLKELTIDTVCPIGVLNEVPYENKLCIETTVSEILYQIKHYLEFSFRTPRYLIYNDDIENVTIDGVLKNLTMRQALQIVCAVVGARVRLSGDNIYIEYQTRSIEHDITKDKKISTEIVRNEFVASVTVAYSEWDLSSEETLIYDEILEEGVYTIYFTNPYQYKVYTHDGYVGFTTNGFKSTFIVFTAGQVTIYGREYEETVKEYTKEIDTSSQSDVGINKKVTYQLCTEEQAKEIADRLLDYYQLRQVIKAKFLMDGTENLGEWAFISDPISDMKYIAGLEELDIDLTGGVIANAKLVGYYNHQDEFNYMGNGELYMGGDGLI